MTRRTTSAGRRAPSSMGTVRQLPSGKWRAFYRREGRTFSAPATFATRAEANAWLASEVSDRARGSWRDPEASRTTLEDFASTWLATRADLAPKTREIYEYVLDSLILPRVGASTTARGVELGAMTISNITPATVRAWYAAALSSVRARMTERASLERAAHADPVRAWAKATGRPVAATGRLSPALVAAWEASGRPLPRREVAAISENAGRAAVTSAYRLLRTVLNVAVSDGMIDRSPCQIRGAGDYRAAERGTASPAEVAELAKHMPRHLSAAVLLAAWSGLRAGELFALARRHVDLDARTVTVERALLQLAGERPKFGTPKTAKSRRTVNLPGFIVDALKQHLAEFVDDTPDALVFTLENGSPVTAPRRSMMFGRARAAIGRDDLTWHDLRHTGATLAYRAGASVPEVQRRLGHTTMRAAQIYAHAVDDSDRVLAERLDALYAADSSAPKLRAL